MPAFATGFRRPRSSLVPRQPSTSRRPPREGPALGIPTASADRDRLVSYCPTLAVVSGVRDPDLVTGAVRSSRVFCKRIFALSEMARARPDSCSLGLRRHHGITDLAETSRLSTARDPKRESEEVRWSVAGVCRRRRRNAIVWLDSAR